VFAVWLVIVLAHLFHLVFRFIAKNERILVEQALLVGTSNVDRLNTAF